MQAHTLTVGGVCGCTDTDGLSGGRLPDVLGKSVLQASKLLLKWSSYFCVDGRAVTHSDISLTSCLRTRWEAAAQEFLCTMG